MKEVTNKMVHIVSVSYRSYILSYNNVKEVTNKMVHIVSVSYRSYILSYFYRCWNTKRTWNKFSFRLLSELYSFLLINVIYQKSHFLLEFPSPIGVIFFLIKLNEKTNQKRYTWSFRLLSELYSFLFLKLQKFHHLYKF